MEYLFELTVHPILLVLAIFGFSWLWEDGAVIAGALLAVDQSLPVMVAALAAYLGIISGDFALYMIGRLANKRRRLRAWVMIKPQFRRMSRSFKAKTLTNIFIIRFIPGLRAVGFTLCGLWQIPSMRFVLAMSLAGGIWISVIFSGVYYIGSAEFFYNSHWKWSLMLVALAMLVLNNITAFRPVKRLTKKG